MTANSPDHDGLGGYKPLNPAKQRRCTHCGPLGRAVRCATHGCQQAKEMAHERTSAHPYCASRHYETASETPQDVMHRLYGNPIDVDKVWEDRNDQQAIEKGIMRARYALDLEEIVQDELNRAYYDPKTS